MARVRAIHLSPIKSLGLMSSERATVTPDGIAGDRAFVLLDDAPGEVLPVGRGPELPGLLTALDELAVRPH